MAAKKVKGKAGRPKKSTETQVTATKLSEIIAPPLVDGLAGNKLKQALKEFMGQYNNAAGHKVAAFAYEVPNTYELRRPCGIMQLDIDTGGGLPAGGLSYISGPDGAGKSFLIMMYMLMHQKLYGERSSLAFGSTEGGFDFRRAINIGLKIAVPDEIINQWNTERKLRGFPAYTQEEWLSFKEQVGEFVILGGATGEEILQTVLGAVTSKLFGIIAIDSISIILPSVDAPKDLDQHNKMSSHATLLTDFMKKYTPSTCGLDGLNYTTLIFSAQVKANMAKAEAQPAIRKYLKEWATTGAWATRHGKLIDIIIWNGQKIVKTQQGIKTVIGKTLHWDIAKGKAGCHDNVQGETPFYYDFYYPPGANRFESIVTAGMHSGIIVERNSKIHLLKPETSEVGDIKDIPGLKNLEKMMEVDFDFELAVRREVLASRRIQCLYR